MNLTLQRLEESDTGPTFGKITDDADGTLVVPATLELPDGDNAPDVSRIPAGVYLCQRFDSPHIGYELFQLQHVPNRSGVDIHIGNTKNDTEGCILVGLERGTLGGQPAILHSKDAFAEFMDYTQSVDAFTLTVKDVE